MVPNTGIVALLGSGHWEQDGWELGQGKVGYGSYCYGNNVVSLQINTAGIMAMNRVDRIEDVRLYPYSPYGCAGHSAPLSLKGCTNDKIHHQNTNYE